MRTTSPWIFRFLHLKPLVAGFIACFDQD